MKLNSPLPQSLPNECKKAAKIFSSFVDNGNNGLDGVIPREVLEQAKGFAIFTIFKAGFVFSARAGSGIVIARLDDGVWSAPSAIGTAGLGLGGQAGAEVTDFLIVLNSRSALKSFMSAGSLTLGGNASLALGPLGRNGEASGSLNTSGKVAAMYSYSKTRGLFGGISIEGSVIVERQDANALAYNSDVTVSKLLSGSIEPPQWAMPLIQTLESCTGMPGGRKWIQDNQGGSGYAFNGLGSPANEDGPSFLRKKKRESKAAFPPQSWGRPKATGSYFDEDDSLNRPSLGSNSKPPQRSFTQSDNSSAANFATHFDSDFVPGKSDERGHRPNLSWSNSNRNLFDSSPTSNAYHSRSMSTPKSLSNTNTNDFDPFSDLGGSGNLTSRSRSSPPPYITSKPELTKPLMPNEGVARAIALFDFKAVEPGDLSFSKGDVITVVKKSNSTDDWWRGKLEGREGIFPANFVELVRV